MASTRLCSIDGCNKPTVGRGWCRKHYSRWYEHGDPLILHKTPNGEPEHFFAAALAHDSDDCLLWPYAQNGNGYGQINRDGAKYLTHRLICAETNGPPPSPEFDAAHKCGNRLCLNPRHLRWATRIENMADCIEHGTTNRGPRHGNSKLTDDDVIAIRKMSGTMRQKEIAAIYNISFQTVSKIVRRERWDWLE